MQIGHWKQLKSKMQQAGMLSKVPMHTLRNRGAKVISNKTRGGEIQEARGRSNISKLKLALKDSDHVRLGLNLEFDSRGCTLLFCMQAQVDVEHPCKKAHCTCNQKSSGQTNTRAVPRSDVQERLCLGGGASISPSPLAPGASFPSSACFKASDSSGGGTPLHSNRSEKGHHFQEPLTSFAMDVSGIKVVERWHPSSNS